MELFDPAADGTPNGWLLNPATNLLQFVCNETMVCGLTRRVLQSSDMLPGLLAVTRAQVVKLTPNSDDAFARMLEYTKSDAAFAAEEIKNGFNTIFSHHAVALWAGIETALEQTLINLIRKVPNAHDLILTDCPALNEEKFKTKTANDAEKAILLWSREIKAHSFERSIHMLRALSFDVQVPEHHRHALIELSEVRNVLVHRGGFVDARFLAKCRWLDLKVGAQFKIDADRMDRYNDAAGKISVAMIKAAVECPFIYKAPPGTVPEPTE
jgi:hypothetical protein